MPNTTTCINCQTETTSNYCPNCGQKKDVRPVSWRGLFDEFNAMWWGFDNKLMRTVWGMIIHPKTVIESYLEGNRVRYIGPLSYLIIMSAIFILTFELTGVSPREYIEVTGEAFQVEQPEDVEIKKDQAAFMDAYMKGVSDNMRLLSGGLIPFLALSLLIFYRGRNYLQNFLIVTFITSELIWLSVVAIVIYAYFEWPIQLYLSIPSLIYTIWIFGSIHPSKNKVWTWIKPFFAWLVGYILFMLTIMIVGVSYFLLFAIDK